MLLETGEPFEHVELGGRFGGLDNSEYLALNSHARVPTLCDDLVVVWESNTIIRYLAAKYIGGTLWSQEVVHRAFADQWIEWSQTLLYPDFNQLFWMTVCTPEDEKDTSAIRDLQLGHRQHSGQTY